MYNTINVSKDLKNLAEKHGLQAALISVVKQMGDINSPLQFHYTEVYELVCHKQVNYMNMLKMMCEMQEQHEFLPKEFESRDLLKKIHKELKKIYEECRVKKNNSTR